MRCLYVGAVVLTILFSTSPANAGEGGDQGTPGAGIVGGTPTVIVVLVPGGELATYHGPGRGHGGTARTTRSGSRPARSRPGLDYGAGPVTPEKGLPLHAAVLGRRGPARLEPAGGVRSRRSVRWRRQRPSVPPPSPRTASTSRSRRSVSAHRPPDQLVGVPTWFWVDNPWAPIDSVGLARRRHLHRHRDAGPRGVRPGRRGHPHVHARNAVRPGSPGAGPDERLHPHVPPSGHTGCRRDDHLGRELAGDHRRGRGARPGDPDHDRPDPHRRGAGTGALTCTGGKMAPCPPTRRPRRRLTIPSNWSRSAGTIGAGRGGPRRRRVRCRAASHPGRPRSPDGADADPGAVVDEQRGGMAGRHRGAKPHDGRLGRPRRGRRRSGRRPDAHRRHAALVRDSCRVDASGRTEQVLAANVDLVIVVHGLDRPLKPGRLERSLVLTWDSGAVPLVVLTKLDLVDPSTLDAAQTEMATLAPGVEVLAVGTLEPRASRRSPNGWPTIEVRCCSASREPASPRS